MCGIAGYVGAHEPGLADRMARLLDHRGPDDAGETVVQWSDSRVVALAHRRLAIIDLEGGRQPFTNEDGTVHLVFNGEIYNFQELRRDLERSGHRFLSRSDGEVIVHLYEEHGLDCVSHLRGMFAFALWDEKRQRLVLARDRLGVKPLYYALPTGGTEIAFGSELKALFEVPDLELDLDLESVAAYLTFLYIPHPRTIVRQARKLPPAHIVVYEGGRAVEKRYWGLDSVEFADSAEGDSFWEIFEESVRMRLIADVPVGAFLSGGLDSSAVVAAAATARETPLETFTVTFRGAGERLYDESAKAASVARAFSTSHHELVAAPAVDELLSVLVRHFDEPFGNATALISHAIAGLTRQHVKVALDGAGGDELLAGYSRFRGALAMSRYRRVPAPVRSLVAAAAGALPESTRGRHGLRRAREFVRAPTSSVDDAYLSWITHFNGASRAEVLSPEVIDALRGSDPPETFVRDLFDRAPREDIVNRVSFVDLQSYLPCNVLEYGDRMSMANGLEVRSPFVDHKLVEHVYALPGSAKLAGAQTKVLLRAELRSRVPNAVLSGPKVGFNPPMGVWLRRDLAPVVKSHLAREQVAARGLLRADAVERLVGTLRTGRRDVSQKVWALIVLEEWLRAYGHRVSVPW